MKKERLLFVCLLLCSTILSHAQRRMEQLDRSVVAMKVTGGNYINWRITADEWYDVAYNVYRDGTLLNEEPITGASNWTDASGNANSVYTVTSLRPDGAGGWIESKPSKGVTARQKAYIAIKVKERGENYYLNDATAADLDGDGEYEIIVKHCYGGSDKYAVGCTQFSYFEAYKLDGTFLWEICVGPNILPDVEVNIAAFDLDEDGKAEVFLRTSEGVVFGDGTVIGDVGNEEGAFTPDGVTNYRYGVSQEANMSYMIYGPEMLSLVDGATGKELDRVPFIPRGKASDWGDGYGHRCSKYFFGAPYLDGVHPSLFIGRGIYTQTKMRTYDVVDKKLVLRWSWESGTSGAYYGQGNHNYTIADVDWDGRDEITWGQMAIDENGKPLYSTGLGHGDAMHVGDFDPFRKGQEVFSCLESSPQHGILFRDASTGKILLHKTTSGDCGRCCAGNISENYKGAELWGGGYGYAASDLEHPLNHFGTAENYTIYWDGDLTKEILDHQDFTTGKGYGYGSITKFIGYNNIKTLLRSEAISCNYTKGTPCLQADILGDWREEAIWHSEDEQYLYIYTTPYETDYRFYTLMHDHQYRQAICWQMCGYNQPPHTSFFLGKSEGITLPPPPAAVNGKAEWTASSGSVWQQGTSFIDWNDSTVAYADGMDVLFDVSASSDRKSAVSLSLGSDVQPHTVTVNSPAGYSIDGNGHSITGAARLDKLGDGTLTLTGEHTYTGRTDVWFGGLKLDGTLESDLWMNRFTVLSGKAHLKGNVQLLYDATIQVSDTTLIDGTLTMEASSRLTIKISPYPSDSSASQGRNAMLKVGHFTYRSGAIVNLQLSEEELGVGRYILMESADSLPDVSGLKLTGLKGFVGKLSAEGKQLILTTKGVRSASSVVWSGLLSTQWDRAVTANWINKDGDADIFVTGDTVSFTDDAAVTGIQFVDELLPGVVNVAADSINFVFGGSGTLSGGMSLVKSGKGTLTINNRNSFTGKTVVTGGKLIMKYAPTETGNGGIGTNQTAVNLLQVSGGAELQVTTKGEVTNRGMTIGKGGMVLNTPVDLTWKGKIQGTTLNKTGSSQLRLAGVNSTLEEIVVNAGTLYLDETNSEFSSAGKKITLNAGTLKFDNNVNSYSKAAVNLSVPANCTGTVWLDGRCSYSGSLTGGGTLNLVTDFVRADLAGNWSAFTGKIVVTANSANSKYNDDMRIANSYGLPKAWLHVSDGVYVYPTSEGTKFTVGNLTGSSKATLTNLSLEVGGLNQNGTFQGVIEGSYGLIKTGSGTLTLSGANTYKGTTNVNSGCLVLKGSLASATVNVKKGAVLSLAGTIAGKANVYGTLNGTGGTIKGNVVSQGALLTPADSTSLGTFTFGGNLTLDSTSVVEMQIEGGMAPNCDKLKVGGTMTCAGKLKVGQRNTTEVQTGKVYKLFEGKLEGTFNEVSLPSLPEGLAWNTSLLYSIGSIYAVKATALDVTDIEAGVIGDPATGTYRVTLSAPAQQVDYTVYNLHGQAIMQGTADACNGSFEIDLSSSPKGVYMLRLYHDNNPVNVFRLTR